MTNGLHLLQWYFHTARFHTGGRMSRIILPHHEDICFTVVFTYAKVIRMAKKSSLTLQFEKPERDWLEAQALKRGRCSLAVVIRELVRTAMSFSQMNPNTRKHKHK